MAGKRVFRVRCGLGGDRLRLGCIARRYGCCRYGSDGDRRLGHIGRRRDRCLDDRGDRLCFHGRSFARGNRILRNIGQKVIDIEGDIVDFGDGFRQRRIGLDVAILGGSGQIEGPVIDNRFDDRLDNQLLDGERRLMTIDLGGEAGGGRRFEARRYCHRLGSDYWCRSGNRRCGRLFAARRMEIGDRQANACGRPLRGLGGLNRRRCGADRKLKLLYQIASAAGDGLSRARNTCCPIGGREDRAGIGLLDDRQGLVFDPFRDNRRFVMNRLGIIARRLLVVLCGLVVGLGLVVGDGLRLGIDYGLRLRLRLSVSRLNRMIDDRRRGRSVVTLELAQQFIFEIEGRLLPWCRFDGVCRYTGLKTDDTRKLRKGIVVSKEVRIVTRVIRPLFICHTHPLANAKVSCQRIVGKW